MTEVLAIRPADFTARSPRWSRCPAATPVRARTDAGIFDGWQLTDGSLHGLREVEPSLARQREREQQQAQREIDRQHWENAISVLTNFVTKLRDNEQITSTLRDRAIASIAFILRRIA